MGRIGTIARRISLLAGAAFAGASLSATLSRNSRMLPAALRQPLERTNHRGRTVTLIEGPVLAAAATSTAVGVARNPQLAGAAAVAGIGAGVVGLYDDLVGSRPDQKEYKGFRGHLKALREGRVSAGLVKVVGIGAAGLAAGTILHPKKPFDALLSGAIIAGMANLVNLFDLRPGRAIKAGIALGAPLLPGPAGGVAAGTLGAAAGVLADDLKENTMLGDAGANAMGALLGVSLARSSNRAGKLAALAAITGLTLASERVSFTSVIEKTPFLRALDELGRQPR